MGRSFFAALVALALVAAPAAAASGEKPGKPAQPRGRAADHGKLDGALNDRATRAGWSRVIVTLIGSDDVSSEVIKLGGRLGRRQRRQLDDPAGVPHNRQGQGSARRVRR